MYKTTIKVDGMMCGMCEAHIQDAIRKAYPEAKKVKASRSKKEATFLTDEMPDEEDVINLITDTGYGFMGVWSEPYKKRGLFG